jgi:DNA-binding CsgD family transcriptional regulator
MNNEQAYSFMNNVLEHLVVNADVDALSQLYHADVVGHYGDVEINFSDIENRCRYLRDVFTDRSHILHEVIVADDKLIGRDRQIMTHRNSGELWVSEVTAAYTVRNNKVAELWLMTDKNMDYRETPQHALVNAIPNHDDIGAKKHFRRLIADEKFLVNGKLQKVELTNREFDVLFYTMRGLTAKEIGQRIDISFRTVESYLETLKDKFACDSKADLRRKVTPGAVWM